MIFVRVRTRHGAPCNFYGNNLYIKYYDNKTDVLRLPVMAPCGTGYSFGGIDEKVAVSG